MRRFGALLLAAAVLALAAPASAAKEAASDPNAAGFVAGTLPGGGHYVVRPTPGTPAAAVALWYRAPTAGFDNPTPGLAQLAASAVAASVPITGTPLGQYIDQIGGRIGVSTYPDSISISAVVPASKASAVVKAMTAAYFTPVLTEPGLLVAKRDVAQDAALHGISSEDTLRDSLAAQLFSDGPAHYPAFGSPQSLRDQSIARVRDYAARAFRAQNAVLVVTGGVDAAVIASAVTGRAAGAEPEDAVAPEPNAPSTITESPASVTKEGFDQGYAMGWIGPSITDEAQATALDFVADYLFRPDSGVVSQALASTDVALVGQFVTYHDPGVMLISLTGKKTDLARPIVERELEKLQTPLDSRRFAAARDAFVYHILSDLQTPGQLADTFGWYSVEGAPEYAPGAYGLRGKYFESATSLTPAAVASAVKRYLSKAPATVTLVEKKK